MQVLGEVLHTAGARQFFGYWDSLPKENFVPDRKDFDPLAIHRLMPFVSILEVVSPDRVEMRLIGTDLVQRMGYDPTGQNYLDSFEPEVRAQYLDILNTQIDHPCGRRSTLRTREKSGILSSVEVLALPMSHARSGHPLLVSCFANTQSIGFNPGEREVQGLDDIIWIDIGAGVPDVV
ncbi:MAG: PAS domain-containing protein [Parvibaculum sp.]